MRFNDEDIKAAIQYHIIFRNIKNVYIYIYMHTYTNTLYVHFRLGPLYFMQR